ncbi:hypothetical protein SAMN06265348_110262 [Pedobacter westerhofensis]|uniref:Uncharacterized protein n=1 Tax=Pedobacter westerhofensis TaxID=425512 RepID=A0A521F7M3_9SPHI|nr:hypothetical protein [Pedobacter westerhofensis]SMO92094.1 hypothetical protein SAMN06265348_110262 [Pedobacter westerhofensis]
MQQFKKHSQENNKDQTVVAELEAMWNTTKHVSKNYKKMLHNSTTTQKKVNPMIHDMYHMAVESVKELYSKLPNQDDRVIIELNLKACPLDVEGLYCIATPHFFFHLECDVYTNYKIEYQFCNCPFEKEIQAMIDKFALRSYSTEVMRQPDYPSFFNRALRNQPERFIRVL